jgi:hypothetical protein
MQRYTYLLWLRAGAAGAITGQHGAGLAASRATFQVTVQVDRAGDVSRDVALHGPGDVVGISPRQILRRFPPPDTTTANAGAFAHVELDEPDLPWRYTPFHERTTADPPGTVLRAEGTLPPWVCLVVLRRGDDVLLEHPPGALPVLTAPVAELPNLAEIAAWAHVQVAGDLPTDPTSLFEGEQHRSLARLVCPRLLALDTPYLACLVPAFEAGRQAGLGEPVTASVDDYAWAAADTTVRLPVYDSWTFVTGPGGDFEALVRRLKHVHLDDLTDESGAPLVVGRRPLDVGAPGFGVVGSPGATADLYGALALDGTDGAAGAIDTGVLTAVDMADAVAPPVYARWHAAVPVPGAPGWPGWLARLNGHPGLRATAGQGARVVQQRQEEFMAACWEQVGAVLEANQLLRQSQLALHASTALHRRHVSVLDPPAALQVLGPALSRLRSPTAGADPRRTQWADVAATCLPVLALSGHWRRALRARGPLVRRIERWLTRDEVRPAFDPTGLVVALAAGDRLGPQPEPDPAVQVPIGDIVAALAKSPIWPDPVPPPTDVSRLADALTTFGRRRAAPPACTPNPLADSAAAAMAAADPAVTVPLRARARLRLPAGLWDPPDRIDPIMVAPEITTPMYGALAALGQDWLLPGLQHVPADSVSALASNQAFVEAFLTGMNSEMGRELLWRGYPTDQRGTVFGHFWDRRVATPDPPPDITALHTWPATSTLGSHAPGGTTGDAFVFLLRGELLRRFPRASIFLVKATVSRGVARPRQVDARAKLPVFSGWLQPDVTFLGFDVPPDEVRGANPPTTVSPGWFVVIQEQPTQPSFGVSAESGELDTDGRYRSWADLGAGDLATTAAGYLDLAATTTAQFLARAPSAGPAWDGRSDSLAAAFLRRPFRLFLHGSDILGTA